MGAALIKRTCPACERTFESDALYCPHDGAALDPIGEATPDSDPYIGMVVHGDIEIRSVAGVGAMGRVYRAHQRGIDRDVAVKILHRELSGNLPLVQRFHREAKIASKLQHPHVVEVYLAGQLPNGALYIAMEYLDGMSLAAALQAANGIMSLERAITIVLQICDAVGEGHARGIVHRDLKPENVMLIRRADTNDWVKVLDFGIAKVSLGDQSMETAAGLIFGTARYISPEGAQGATVKPPGDVYSIAVMLYQLLAGKTPFDADQPVGLLIKHIHDEPPPLRSHAAAAGVPVQIERVIMDNLVKDPLRRSSSARAFGNALASAAKEANVSLSDVGVIARMSIVGPPPVSSGVEPGKVGALDPTLDDVIAPPTKPVAVISVPPPTTPSPAPASIRPTVKKNAPMLVILAFLLGVAMTALVMQHLAGRKNDEHELHVQHARLALARGNYVEPPNDNVRDLVASGLQKWPDDAELAKIQSDAAHEVVTRAMAARSGGDVTGARDLAKTARALDPTDGTARLLLSQYEDELNAAEDAGSLGGPRVALDVPIGRARPGARAELIARIQMGTAKPDVSGAQFVVTGPGLESDGLTVTATGTGPFRAVFVPPREGTYEIQFEANVAGATVRANRSLAVAR